MVVVGFLALTIQTGMRYSFGVLLSFMVDDLTGSLTAVTAGFSVHMLAYTVTSPLAGALIDRLSARTVLLVGAVLSGCALMAVGAAGMAWQVLVLYGFVSGVAGHGFGVIAANQLIVPRFTTKLGLAVGLTNSGVSFGAAVFPPLVGAVVGVAGWRVSWLVVGAIVVVVLVPLGFLLVPAGNPTGPRLDTADTPGQSTDDVVLLRRHVELWQDLRFYYIFIGFFLAMWVQLTLVVHLAGSGLGRGFSPQEVGLAIGVLGGVGVVMRIGFSWLSDRLPVRGLITIPGTLLIIGGLLVLSTTTTTGGYWIAVPIIGSGMAIYGPLFAMIIADTFPDFSYARTMGTTLLGVGTGGALGPVVFAYVRQQGVTDQTAWLALVPLATVSLVLFLAALRRAPRHTRVVTDRTKAHRTNTEGELP